MRRGAAPGWPGRGNGRARGRVRARACGGAAQVLPLSCPRRKAHLVGALLLRTLARRLRRRQLGLARRHRGRELRHLAARLALLQQRQRVQRKLQLL